MAKPPRLIINAKEDNWIFAIRAAKALASYPDSKDLVVSYGGLAFYVKRNKASISVFDADYGHLT